MRNVQDDVEDFMMAADQPCNISPAYTDEPQELLYMRLVEEEYNELLEAYAARDIVETADAICDIVWVLMGLASTLGIPFEACWDEVRRSNMSKVVDGRLMKNPETGKVMKPEGYFSPDLEKVMFDEPK